MNAYETTTTVDDSGQVRVSGVPFDSGTEVRVIIEPARNGRESDAADRTSRLFASLDKARNAHSIGPLRREELYDRNVLR